MRTFFILSFLLLISFSSFSQEKLGIANSNYSSTNSVFLNPSTTADSRVFFQLNVIGLNAFLHTNQVYLPDFSIRKKHLKNLLIATSSTQKKSFAYSNIGFEGTTAVVSYENFGIGTFVRARAMVDARNIPFELIKAIAEKDTVFLAQHLDIDLRDVKISEMTWAEYGLNFSKLIRKSGFEMIAVGGNLKYLTGINIAYANLNQFKAGFQDTAVAIENYKAKVRYNSPGWNSGKGIGFDLGITYKKMLDWVDAYHPNSPKSHCKFIDYKYKIGISLLDLGAIRFSRNTYKINAKGATYISRYTNDSILTASLNLDTIINKPIWTTLPTAISAQLEYNFGHHLYGNVVLVQSITTPRMIGVQRQNMVSLTPRYETKNFEVALAFTLQRYKYPMLGLAFRVRSLSIGVDNVIPFIAKNDTYGFGVYFNLGITLFKNPMCWNKHPKIRKKKLFFKSIQYNVEEKKKVGNVDDSPVKDIPKVEEGKVLEEKPETIQSKKQEIEVKRRYQWIHRRKKNYKESKTN